MDKNVSIEAALAATTTELRTLRESVMLLAEELRNLVGTGPQTKYIEAPGVRDPEHPCAEFSPGSSTNGGCEGDGHYLCSQCVFHC